MDENKYVIMPNQRAFIPIDGDTRVFPVRRVFCIGRNYADHAREMGHDPNREAPFFFEKTPYAIYHQPEIAYPAKTSEFHHEVELYVALKSGGKNIPIEAAMNHVFGAGVGLDMTRRDLQAEQKKLGRPWEIGKSFDYSAPVGKMRQIHSENHYCLDDLEISLNVNNQLRQSGSTAQMIWKIPEMISVLSEYFELSAGDVIFTGTPAGVGPVSIGDNLRAKIENFPELELKIIS